MLDILLRHGKNNPVLVGDAGVGKTAIAEAVAQQIASGDVPHSLRGMHVLALDHVALLAGTQFRGQYEERIRGIVAEVTAARDVILFVDELHNLMGQGTALGVAMDAANMLKPALVRGDFRVIGATTGEEYDRWIRGDPALERRFHVVQVRELGSEETVHILRSRVTTLERHHDVVIDDSAVLAAVRLSDIFMPERRRPDRAIDTLDEACAHTHGAARLSAETEALAVERRHLVSGGASRRTRTQGSTARTADATPADEQVAGSFEPAQDPAIELPDFARDGFSLLERFGAELGSLLDGAWADADADALGTRDGMSTSEAAPSSGGQERGSRRTLVEVDAALRDRLVEEGVVVRGHDVARVMSLSTGKSISWVD